MGTIGIWDLGLLLLIVKSGSCDSDPCATFLIVTQLQKYRAVKPVMLTFCFGEISARTNLQNLQSRMGL